MDRIKLFLIAMLGCLAVVASSQSIYDPQWGSATVGNLQAVKYSPAGDYVLTFGNNEVRLWRASNGALMWVRSVPNLIDAGFEPNSSNVLASTNAAILRYSILAGIQGANLSADANARGYFGYSPDGSLVAATLDGTTTYLYSNAGALQTSFASSAGVSTPTVQVFSSTGNPTRILVGLNCYELNGTFVGSFRGAAGSLAQPAAESTSGALNKVFEVEGNGSAFTSLYGLDPTTGSVSVGPIDISGIGITPRALSLSVDRRKTTLGLPANNGATGRVWLLNPATGGTNGFVNTPYSGTFKSVAFSPVNDDFALISNVGSGTEYKLELYNMNTTRTDATRAWVQNIFGSASITQLAIGAAHSSVTNTPIVVTGSNVSSGVQVLNSNTGALFRTITDTLWTNTRPTQMSVSPNGRFLAVVNSGSGNNMRVYDLTTATVLSYGFHVSGVAFFNNTDMVVDGPTTVRVNSTVTALVNIANIWSERSGFIINPVVSPDATKLACFDTEANQHILYSTSTGVGTRSSTGETNQGYGFLTDNRFYTVVINNAGASPSAKLSIYTTVGNALALQSTRTFSTAVIAGGTFGNWTAAIAPNGKWAAFIDAQTDASGNAVNTLRFYNYNTNQTFTSVLRYPGLVKSAAFTADSSRLNVGTSTGAFSSLNVPVFTTAVTCSPTSVFGGNNTTATVTISEPGRIGGTPVNITTSAGAHAPAVVLVPQGATSTNFAVTSDGSNSTHNETVSVATDFGGTVSTTFEVKASTLGSLNPSPDTVTGGHDVTVTVNLNGKAGAGGVTVSLSPVNCTLDSSTVTVPEGSTSTTFLAHTSTTATDKVGKVNGTYNGVTRTATFNVLRPNLTGFTLSANEVVGGNAVIGTVTIADPAPSPGVIVDVTTDSGVTTFGTVTVPTGATTVDFTINTSVVTSDTTAHMGATCGTATINQNLVVHPYAVTTFAITETSVDGGSNITGTVGINAPAQPGGLDVAVTSDNSAVSNFTVHFPEGFQTMNFTQPTTDVSTDQTVTLTGTFGSSSLNDSVLVKSPTLLTFTINQATVKGTVALKCKVTISRPAPAGGAVVEITSDDAAVNNKTITLAAGTTSRNFDLGTHPVADPTFVTVTASTGSSTLTDTVTINPPTATLTCDPLSFNSGTTGTATVTLDVPAPAGWTWNITVNSPFTADASSITFASGDTVKTFGVTCGTVTSTGTRKLQITRGATKKSVTLSFAP